MSKVLRITITFKPNEKWIYDEIKKHSGYSNWVKDILAEYIRKEKENK